MAPLPQNNTGRVFFDYRSGSGSRAREHTFQVRTNAAFGDGGVIDVQGLVLDLLQAMTANTFWDGWQIFRVRSQAAGTNFSLPSALVPGLAAFVGTGESPSADYQEAWEWSYQGRSGDSGRRVDLSLYGLSVNLPGDLRYEALDPAVPWLDEAVAVLNAGASAETFITIDGSPAIWYPYLNANANSYWEGEIRST